VKYTTYILLFAGLALPLRQAADSPTHANQIVEGTALKNKPISSTLTGTPIGNNEASQNMSHGRNISAESKDRSVKIVELPTVHTERDWLDKSAWGFSGLLTIVGCFGVFVAIRTVKAIERQGLSMRRQTTLLTKSVMQARRSANAARRSADALINSERAWVLVDIEWQQGAHIFEGINNTGREDTGIYINYMCRNQGKSFAQITEKGYVFQIVSTLPQEPDFSNIDIFQYASEYIAPGTASEPYRLSGVQCEGHRKFKNMMVIYGYVKYMDVYGEHETRFGYQITGMKNLERLPTTSYPKYNQHT
jgi:hypothetical protein